MFYPPVSKNLISWILNSLMCILVISFRVNGENEQIATIWVHEHPAQQNCYKRSRLTRNIKFASMQCNLSRCPSLYGKESNLTTYENDCRCMMCDSLKLADWSLQWITECKEVKLLQHTWKSLCLWRFS